MGESAADIELAFYEEFFFSRELEPYPVQEQAFAHIFAGESTLVTVPTGTGKTLMAKAGLFRALALGRTAIYTTPLRALTEEKYRELCDDFGDDKVGFATGDYRQNPEAPIQVVVAEILWNRIFGQRGSPPADIVIMDEGHYFNDPERGYVWEQSIIGLDPRTQLVILSATVGHADRFCHWVELCRRVPMHLVESRERRVPLYHELRESYLVEVARDLVAAGDVPAIIFVFGREKCFEAARLLKSCRRFTTDDEKRRIEELCDETLLDGGVAKDLRALLVHGIGIHHAGILPRYKHLVERLTLERLLKIVVSTETISAGINLPAKRVVFPSLRKYIRKKPRLVTPAEFHQMAGRAGRPQFDTEGVAIALAPESIVQEIRKDIKDAKKRGQRVDEEKIRKSAYARARTAAQRAEDVTWDADIHKRLVEGQPAALASKTRITAEQILTIGLPDPDESTEPDDQLPASLHLNIETVVAHLLLSDKGQREAAQRLAQVKANLEALGIIDDHGRQVAGDIIADLRGLDGLFIHDVVMSHQLDHDDMRMLCEFLTDHDVIHRLLSRKDEDKRRAWIREHLRERRRDNPHVTWEDIEEEYEREFPRELSRAEIWHGEFCAKVPHPELHGGKTQKTVWAMIEDEQLGFLDFVDRFGLAHEEGSLFTYLARVMKTARTIHEATSLDGFGELSERIRRYLSVIDARLVASL